MPTMVEPTGVPATMETRMPVKAQKTDRTAEQTVTDLKLLNTRIADMALRMQQSGVATRLVWVSDDDRDESMALIERLKMGGVRAERMDPWGEENEE